LGVVVDLQKYGTDNDAMNGYDSVITAYNGISNNQLYIILQTNPNSIDSVIGTRYADVFYGNENKNYFQGGAGNDVMDGLGNDDIYVGEAGVDTFNYYGANPGTDFITEIDDNSNSVFNIQNTSITLEVDSPITKYWSAATFVLSMDGMTPVMSEYAYSNYLVNQAVNTKIKSVSNLAQPIRFEAGKRDFDRVAETHASASLNVTFDTALGTAPAGNGMNYSPGIRNWDVLVAATDSGNVTKVNFTTPQSLKSLTIEDYSSVKMNSATRGTFDQVGGYLYVDRLTMTGKSTLDLNNFDLIVANAAADPMLLQTVKSYFSNWYWERNLNPQIMSSSIAESQGATTMVPFDNRTVTFMNFDGISLSGGATPYHQIVMKYSYVGDVNFDGQVNLYDSNLYRLYLGQAFSTNYSWAYGDMNDDGKVDVTDYQAARGNFGRGVGKALVYKP
jgi:hypothetical protein